MPDRIRLSEAWKQINEAEMNPMAMGKPQEEMVNLSLTKKELALIKSLVQTAVNEMTSDPNSGMNGVPPNISAVIQKLDTI